MSAYKARLITEHIGECLKRHTGSLPLVVGLQGPQGSGKTTTTDSVKERLERAGSKVAVFSLDDLYKTHNDMQRLARDNSSNALLQGRGQPGTHDMPLGSRILAELKSSQPRSTVCLPVYDKSRHNGQGDRKGETVDVVTPLDVVIFEGWCLGFYPISPEELAKRFKQAEATVNSKERPFFASHSLKSLSQVNELLADYLHWYRHIDAFVQLRPDDLHNVFAWRLEAEHAMKATGRDGMTDGQVHAFVARYMPGYELFGEGVTRADAPWRGNGLRLTIDAKRCILDSARF